MYNRKDMYNDYSDQSLTYYYDTIFNGDVKAMFDWSYGDTTPLSFVFTSEDGFENKEAEITFYNFRYEILYKVNVQANETVVINIDEELTKTFPRGVYYCSSKLIDTENHTIETVIPQDRGLIFVR